MLKLISYALNDNHLDHAFLTTKKEYQVILGGVVLRYDS